MLKIREYVEELRARFLREYGEADCTLDHADALQLLIGAQLATQCTDARVNIVMKDLVKKYPDAAAYAGADTGRADAGHPLHRILPQ